MRAMTWRLVLLPLFAQPVMAEGALTENAFRARMGFPATLALSYRNLECKTVSFRDFADEMAQPLVHADVDRAADGKAATLTARIRGKPRCESPYPPVTELPPFALRDLAGKTVSHTNLRGKPTLLSFYYATCVPCIREVEPLNQFAAARPQMNFLAVTFDDPDVARAFVKRFGLRWRVVPDAREFIERVRIKSYPTVALFAADGRLLGMKTGGARDELEAANVQPQLARWMDGLLRADGGSAATP
jgi:thiol-disulfide isomerase/thioredoxin